jgi:hypothetical protein
VSHLRSRKGTHCRRGPSVDHGDEVTLQCTTTKGPRDWLVSRGAVFPDARTAGEQPAGDPGVPSEIRRSAALNQMGSGRCNKASGGRYARRVPLRTATVTRCMQVLPLPYTSKGNPSTNVRLCGLWSGVSCRASSRLPAERRACSNQRPPMDAGRCGPELGVPQSLAAQNGEGLTRWSIPHATGCAPTRARRRGQAVRAPLLRPPACPVVIG